LSWLAVGLAAFLLFILGVALAVTCDILKYRDLQRRLRKERRKRKAVEG